MPNSLGHTSRDGYQWTPESGLQAGIPCLGTIQPPTKLAADKSTTVYDVAVIGAGYAGLTAIRDLTTTGHKTILIEARDRIGGRSWSSNIGGYPFEMGGTWVHWTQPFIWRELFRYNLLGDNLEVSMSSEGGINKCAVSMFKDQPQIFLTKEREDEISASALRKLVNVDGQLGRTVIPLPHQALHNKEAVAIYDKMSLADRFAQVEQDLTSLEKNLLEGFLSITCGGQWEDASFFELLRWWALSNWNYSGFMEMGLTYKLRCGQSGLQRCLFDEASASGNLAYSFSTPVASVRDEGGLVEIQGRNGEIFQAKRVICAIPLNVLHTVQFTPALLPLKKQASLEGHANHVVKCHVEVAKPELRSLGSFNYPHGKLTYAFGDGTTPAGNTHLVSFGSSLPGVHLQPEEDIEVTLQAWKELLPDTEEKDLKRIVFHNWHKDEFARGAWEWFKSNQVSKYLDALRTRQGNIFFGSADWAMGWRGFLDGGIEDGQRVAKEVADDLKTKVVTANL
ncbi:amine oxidase [Cryphonectria parasitica EP155]|uniref:Amine oxidase n=1 Tax=Cryphonectria parasitica (strain ATCC 38755 / EP155) TaxID=660469 RepID=A0A9P5CL73_CRYP1|nr:amine oxidase [Cryphonectria parasitica EP155]KAF3762768.1 amine oxidase [Cryphonectria parasitica EP155]